jgi:hypothetical protein
MDETRIRALVTLWSERRAEICRTLDRCDSAKAFEVQRCMDELDAALQAASPVVGECARCGGLPPGEASGAGDLCYCDSGDDASREAATRMSVRGPSPAFYKCEVCGHESDGPEQAASPVPRVEWQPIETAPVGTQVWAWDDERGSNPAMLVDGEWHITYDDAIIHPKHWQPLPDPLARKTERGAPSGV